MDVADAVSRYDSFDLLACYGACAASEIIREVEKIECGKGKITHVAVVVRGSYFSFVPNVDKDKTYIIHSTSSSPVVDVESGKFVSGFQVNEAESWLKAYLETEGSLVEHYRPVDSIIYFSGLKEFYREYYGKGYEHNPLELASVVDARIRWLRDLVDDLASGFLTYVCGTPTTEREAEQEMSFCSQIATILYQNLGLIGNEIDPNDVAPEAFIDDDIPPKIAHLFRKV